MGLTLLSLSPWSSFILCGLFCFLSFAVTEVQGWNSYANDFVNPDYLFAGNFGNNTLAARATIVSWAEDIATKGPWSVTHKPFTAPSGDRHDYMSWSPYWWPNCTSVGNMTELAQEQVWTTCPYSSRDGQFNPDARLINDVGNFQDLSDAVLYNAMAWAITGSKSFAQNTANFIRIWFLDVETYMNPNLNFGQVIRGPGSRNGSHTGVLDLKGMTKVVSSILILRKSNSDAWTPDLDSKMNSWVREYVTWLETAPIAKEEAIATNNHGTFYYNQLAALKILLGDFSGAKNVTDTYFNTLYMSQIVRGGEQPLEAARTRPYHYRSYNLAAMITNARLAEYADSNSHVWNKTTNEGATIKDALDFAMTIPASLSKEDNYSSELYPNIAAVASIYGDPDGKYLTFVKQAEPEFSRQAYFLWNQPWGENENLDIDTGSSTAQVDNNDSGQSRNNARNSASSWKGRATWTALIVLSCFVCVLL